YAVAESWFIVARKNAPDLPYINESINNICQKGYKNQISLCLPVKNNEKTIAACLQSTRQLVDEIILLDFGSDDLSLEIARKFGARIYHLPDQSSFYHIKNSILEMALYNWILLLNPDEIIETGKEDFKNLIKQQKTDAYNVPVYHQEKVKT